MRILPGGNNISQSVGNDAKKIDVNNPINSGASFNEILNSKLSLQFSKHASMRLANRDIKLSEEQLERVESGVNIAMKKGIRDSLVFVDNIALVVNVRSKTVVTLMNKENENIFTNIDGAVIV